MSTLETTLRIFPRLHAPRSWRLVERNIASSRGAWLVFVSGFFEPLFYLFAMGVGVGALVGTVDVNGQAVGYREYRGLAGAPQCAMLTGVAAGVMELVYGEGTVDERCGTFAAREDRCVSCGEPSCRFVVEKVE